MLPGYPQIDFGNSENVDASVHVQERHPETERPVQGRSLPAPDVGSSRGHRVMKSSFGQMLDMQSGCTGRRVVPWCKLK